MRRWMEVFTLLAPSVIRAKEVLKMKARIVVVSVYLLLALGLLGCVSPKGVPKPTSPPDPAIEEPVLRDEDIQEIINTANRLGEVGGPCPALVNAAHTLQSRWELLFKALDESMDNEEIPLLLDALHATLLAYIDSLATVPTSEAEVVRPAAQKALAELAGAKEKVDAALLEFVVAHGAPRETIRDVGVGIPQDLLVRVANQLNMAPEDFKMLLDRIPPNQRLTIIQGSKGRQHAKNGKEKGSIEVKPSGKRHPAPEPKWYERAWGKIKQWGAKALARAALAAKLGHLLVQYGYAIIDCYYNHFPDWAAIDDCLVNKHGLAPDVVTRILNALGDP